MTLRRVFRLSALALALVTVLLIGLSTAKPVEERKAVTRPSSLLNVTTTAPQSFGAKASSSSSSSTQITTEDDSLASDNAQMAASSPTSGPLHTFCAAFVEQCYKIALKDQRGEVTITHSCQRQGGKYSTSFTYTCYRGRTKLTAAVLKAMGHVYHAPSTTTIEGLTFVTKVVEDVSTDFDATTTKTTTTTDATITRSSSTEVTEVEVETLLSTVSSTTLIPYTVSSRSTTTTTEVAIFTSYLPGTTDTEVFIGTAQIYPRAPSTFCLAFRIACQSECARVSSRVDTEICDTSESPTYTMACICKNGKRETQHALEAIAEDRKLVSVTSLRTSTTLLTKSRTTTLPTEVLRTKLATHTSLVDVTSTSTSTTTTLAATTVYKGSTTTVGTEIITIPITTTTSTTTEVPTTTRIVLAATGFVHAFDSLSGDDLGSIGGNDEHLYAFVWPNGDSNAVEFMAIRNSPSGLYQLAQVGNPDATLFHFPDSRYPIMNAENPGFIYMSFWEVDPCGLNSLAPGPVRPGASCETYIFNPVALDSSAGATIDTVNLQHFYINPEGSTPTNWSGAWVRRFDQMLVMIIDPAAYKVTYPSVEPQYIDLRFPYET